MKKKSKANEILNHFLEGGKLTVLTCINKFHTTELRKYIARFRQQGYCIKGVYYTDRNGNRQVYKTYFLSTPAQLRLQI